MLMPATFGALRARARARGRGRGRGRIRVRARVRVRVRVVRLGAPLVLMPATFGAGQ